MSTTPILALGTPGPQELILILVILVLLLMLGPAMWHQWISVDAANANFFYSITLLLGVWSSVFLMQMLRLTVLLDRACAGKGPAPRRVPAESDAGGGGCGGKLKPL